MGKLHILARTSLLVLVFALHALAGPGDWILRLKVPSKLSTLTQQFPLTVIGTIDASTGQFLINFPAGPPGDFMARLLKSLPYVQSIDPDVVVALPETSLNHSFSGWLGGSLTADCVSSVPTGTLTPGLYYTVQPAVCSVNLPPAQSAGWNGGGTEMALIDTWVDYTHPVLVGSVDLPDSRDFIGGGNIPLTQETSPMVDQETSPMVDGSGTIILDQETSPMVDQETSPMVDTSDPAYLGHGTGVAGIMHLVAPNATIMVLQAFSTSTGTGNLSDVITAIEWASEHNAKVINMSFSMPGPPSSSLSEAINDAITSGAIVVASLADSPSEWPVYPAAWSDVISVGCTTNSDQLCTFSGIFGKINAPGYQVLSPYPGGKYALYTGTSFSAPWVTGTGALMQRYGSVGDSQAADVIGDSTAGRPPQLDVLKSVLAAQ